MTRRPAHGYAMLEALLALTVTATAVATWHGVQRQALVWQRQQQQQRLAERLLDDWNARFRLLAPHMTTAGWQAARHGPRGTDCQTAPCSPSNFAAWWWADWQQTQRTMLPLAQARVELSTALNGASQWCISLVDRAQPTQPLARRCWFG